MINLLMKYKEKNLKLKNSNFINKIIKTVEKKI